VSDLEMILSNPQLNDREVRILMIIYLRQEDGEFVTRSQISEKTGISISTVQRCIKSLRERDLIHVTRCSSQNWFHDLGPVLERIRSVPIQHGDRAEPMEKSCLTIQHGDHSQPIRDISIIKNIESGEINYRDNVCFSEGETPMRVKNKNKNLRKIISDEETSFQKKKEEKQKKRIVEGGGKERTVAKSNQKISFESKEPSEYNGNDLYYLIQKLWRRNRWRGNPTPFTRKDRKQAKGLIEEQSPEIVVEYFQYVFNNWNDISRRYRFKGMPSLGLLYGFRRQLLPEALNQTEVAVGWGAEYTGSQEDPDAWE